MGYEGVKRWDVKGLDDRVVRGSNDRDMRELVDRGISGLCKRE
jgi:hypothetical protein